MNVLLYSIVGLHNAPQGVVETYDVLLKPTLGTSKQV